MQASVACYMRLAAFGRPRDLRTACDALVTQFSRQERHGILIVDVWNSLIDEVEREQVCAVLEGFDAYYGRVLPWDDRP